MKKWVAVTAFIVYMSKSWSGVDAQQLSKAEIDQVIGSVAQILESRYVYPEKGRKIANVLNKNHRRGVYDDITDELQLVEQIQGDMLAVVNDSHLMFDYNPEHAAQLLKDAENPTHSWEIKSQSPGMERFNYGFQSVKILDGNIGYLKLDVFYDTEDASEVAVAAMNFLGRTDAIIVDLRQNGGGSWKMIQLISSYLFDSTPVHLGGFYWRPEDKQTQHWTLPHVPGNRNPDAEVFILTSANTHSAAEEFSYNLKHLKRARVIGESTMGGAHPGEFVPIGNQFVLLVPHGRSVNPVTGTNWEGTGVQPDTQVTASEALEVAKLEALQRLSEKFPGSHGDLHRWFLVSQQARLNPVSLSQATLQSYAGTYGPRTLVAQNGQLYYQRAGGSKLLLNALAEDLFELDVDHSFRMKIIRNDGQAVAVQGLFDNGYTDQFPRSD
ncbi:S41 family peptidase [Marinicella sediminis]|uniref:S41 family peptidase n=1 Tax=Marinicella sediminis TaxID=1792834 RepID=A0ABV7JFG2_9GAMM|nr:S41 family peptidase [Marinicella sediminis]